MPTAGEHSGATAQEEGGANGAIAAGYVGWAADQGADTGSVGRGVLRGRPAAAGEEDQDGRGEPDHLHLPSPPWKGGGARMAGALGEAVRGVKGSEQGVGRQG